MSQHFKKNARLSRSKDFQWIFKKGTFLRNELCRIYACPNAQTQSRLGVIVAKKVIPKATHRHQWKRVVRETFRMHPKALSGYDIIVMIKKPPYSNQHLRQGLEAIWEKIEQWHARR